MKILTIIPESYTLQRTLMHSFEQLTHEVINLDYRTFFRPYQNRVITKTIGLPNTIKKRIKIHEFYRATINQKYLENIYKYQPDLIVVYNDQYLTFETSKEIRNLCKLSFILGDNPFFYLNHPLNELGMYLSADYVFSADSFITESFRKAGQPNAAELYLGYDSSICYPKQPNEEELKTYSSDIVMIGRLYPTLISTWTYKRLHFYNQFISLNMTIYGHGWNKYRKEFPDLIKLTQELNHYLTFDEVNTILSCCKVYPIDANPGIINGIHLRVFDCIGSEILPIAESTRDLIQIFSEVELPVIYEYSEAEKVVKYYTENNDRRERIIKELKQFIDTNYTPINGVQRILDKVFNA